jgi:hypothetical protein
MIAADTSWGFTRVVTAVAAEAAGEEEEVEPVGGSAGAVWAADFVWAALR